MFNAMTADYATGLSTCITKDGQTATTARIPFASGINSTLATDATNTSSGSIISAGGLGLAKAAWIGGLLNVTGHVTFEGVTSTGATGTGKLVFDGTPTLVTPVIGVATATSVNKVAITAPASSATLTIADGKTLTCSNTLTFAGTDGKGINVGAATSLKILVGDGSNMVLSAYTHAAPGTSGNVLTSDGTNWTSAAPSGGVTSITGTANQVIASQATGAVTLSLPQSIGTGSAVIFGSLSTSGIGVIGGPSATHSGLLTVVGAGNAFNLLIIDDTTNTSGTVYTQFYSNTVLSGQIARVGTTAAVVYTTTSDARLKNIFGDAPLAGAVQRLGKLPVREFEWKGLPGSRCTDFIAQELHRTHPLAVRVGGKDETKDPWQIDRAGVIPDLVLGWKSHEARLQAIEKLLTKG